MTTVTDENGLTALDIARKASLVPIASVAHAIGIGDDLSQPYGEYVAKIKLDAVEALADRGPGARLRGGDGCDPHPPGRGQDHDHDRPGPRECTMSAGAAPPPPSANRPWARPSGSRVVPPAAGYSQAAPFEALNLHLTGDMHAVTAAHNTLSALLDNHLYQGNELGLDPSSITWRRVLDVNDRVLRNIVVGLGSQPGRRTRQSGFDITAASEVMAILALSTSLQDMRRRFGR